MPLATAALSPLRRGRMVSRRERFGLLLLVWVCAPAASQCPSRCSGHGRCNSYSKCDCWNGWQGADCSLRTCAAGTAWFDVASSTDSAHAPAECANMGHCDRATGLCNCRAGFEGMACERMACPNSCSGHGQCLSLSSAASIYDGFKLNHTTSYENVWDARMIYGCTCDVGFSGFDCSLRDCGRGDDFRTLDQRNEVATLYCVCPPPCSGTFQLLFQGKRSIDIPFDANNGTLAAAIMDLPGIHSDAWVFEDPPIIVSLSAGDKVCSARGVRSTIRFTRDAGDQPPFVVESALSTGARINNVTAVMETVQTLNCSCKGKCGGTFTLTYDAETTEPISFNATNGTITKALLALESLAVGDVSVGRPSSGSTFCMDDSNTSITVTFTMAAGNQPALVATSSLTQHRGQRGGQISVFTNDGTKESAFCNECGTCNTQSGECLCDQAFGSHHARGPCGRVQYNTSSWTGLEKVRAAQRCGRVVYRGVACSVWCRACGV